MKNKQHFEELMQQFLPRQEQDEERAAIARLRDSLDGRQSATCFPVQAFPGPIADILQRWQAAYHLPVDYYGTGVLVAASAVIGNAYQVEYRLGQCESLILYAALVGVPGLGKTPAIKTVLAPLFAIDREYRRQHRQDLAQWEVECEQVKGKAAAPPRPQPRELVLNDATVEAISQVLGNNPRGLLYFRDELISWFNSMNQYRQGSDNEFWISNWSNTFSKVNRVMRDDLYVPDPFLSVIGGIQPGLLQRLTASYRKESGFLARILFAFPADQRIPPRPTVEPAADCFERYDALIRYLHALPDRCTESAAPFGERRLDPFLIPLSPPARKRFDAFDEQLRARGNEVEEETQKSLYVKMLAYTLRFSLLLELLDLAAAARPIDQQSMQQLEVCEHSMQGALALTAYFIETGERVQEWLDSPVRGLTKKQRALYEALPEVFDRPLVMAVAGKVGISRATVTRFLNRRKLLRKRGNQYEKIYTC